MATVTAGQTVSFFVPLSSSITFTPGTSGKLSVNGRNADGSAIAPREVYSATTVSVDAGAWVSVEASVADGTYLFASISSSPDYGLLALSEATPYVTLTATGTAFSGACELAGWYCSVAAGNITIYDNTSATGTPIVPATALVAGPMPIFGAGTNARLLLTTGCHVVLSGAATVRVAVGA